jgi:hypothetical protein
MSRLDPALKRILDRRKEQKAALKKELFAKPVKKGEMTAELRLAKLESLVIALYEAISDASGSWNPLGASCDHERWKFFVTEHEFELSHLASAAIESMIRREKGKCRICEGDARV